MNRTNPSVTRPRRPARRVDGLALHRAIPDRSLPALVAAMTFLAALALAGASAARTLSERWAGGAGAIVTIQVPDPDSKNAAGSATDQGSRADQVLRTVKATPGVLAAHRLDKEEMTRLLSPWLGAHGDFSLPLPAIIEITLEPSPATAPDFATGLEKTLDQVAPGTLVEQNSVWSDRLAALANSLQACAAIALVVVTAVAATVIGMATRSGLLVRRRAIEIVHGLGASDGYIANRFARRTGWLAFVGGLIGAGLVLPLLGVLARLAAPFASAPIEALALDTPSSWSNLILALPTPLLCVVAGLPVLATIIGWCTAQISVHLWLRHLP